MTDSDQRAFAESVFERDQRREAESTLRSSKKTRVARRQFGICIGSGRCAWGGMEKPTKDQLRSSSIAASRGDLNDSPTRANALLR
jgi:hypothetical protein